MSLFVSTTVGMDRIYSTERVLQEHKMGQLVAGLA